MELFSGFGPFMNFFYKIKQQFVYIFVYNFVYIFQVVDVRINNKGVAQSKNLPDGTKGVPNFGKLFYYFFVNKSKVCFDFFF